MSRYATYYYLLFVLLIMGAFASMAQNDYGIKILGLVATTFSFLFAIQLISFVNKKNYRKNINGVFELFSLILLSGILAMRVFYIRFPFVELIFVGAGLLLVLVYLRKLAVSYSQNKRRSKIMARLVVLFHASIICYVLSMISVAFIPLLSEPLGGVAFALLIAFVAISLLKKEILMGGEKVTPFRFVARFKDRAVVLITLFLLFTAYMGLTKIKVLPRMYSDEFPQAYFEFVSRAENGNEKPINGKYKHEEFMERYSRFVEQHVETHKE